MTDLELGFDVCDGCRFDLYRFNQNTNRIIECKCGALLCCRTCLHEHNEDEHEGQV